MYPGVMEIKKFNIEFYQLNAVKYIIFLKQKDYN